jgi:hypothetical protein
MANTWTDVTLDTEVNESGLRVDQRPRGAPNIREISQIGITITAPSRK